MAKDITSSDWSSVLDMPNLTRSKSSKGGNISSLYPGPDQNVQDRTGFSTTINADNAVEMIGGNSSFSRRVDGEHEEHDLSVLQSAAVLPDLVANVFGAASGNGDDGPYAEIRCLLPDTSEEGTVAA